MNQSTSSWIRVTGDRVAGLKMTIGGVVAALVALGGQPLRGDDDGAAPSPASTGAADRQIRGPLQLETVESAAFIVDSTVEPSWTVVCFLGTECPLAKLYAVRLQTLADEFQKQSVQFVGVFSNRQDSPREIQHFTQSHGIRFPSVHDEGNRIADEFVAERTPQVFVLDNQLQIRYEGRIDDQYLPGVSRAAPVREDLREALQSLVSGVEVKVAKTQAAGCLIGRVLEAQPDSEITYCNRIAAILNKHCVECHRSGEIGPFSLTDYDEIVGWAEMIQEVVDDQRMPPWHASEDSVALKNTRRMSADEKGAIRKWVEAGAPFGEESQLPQTPSFVSGWQLPREPDLVLEMRNRPFIIPADGTVEYQYFVVDPGFTEDRWVSAAQVVPGNNAVVHHAIVFVRPPDGARFRGVGWVTAYVPGQRVPDLLPGHARLIPAGSKLVFQMHYTPNGDVQEDLSKIGMVFMNEEDVSHERYTVVGIDQEFEIPPFASEHSVKGRVGRYPRTGKLLAVIPHMHVRGKSFQLWKQARGEPALVLNVPRYDFNWKHIYELQNPLPLSDVESMEFDVKFDNSSSNPVNPDPSQFVTWGDQTWEEMAIVFLEVAEPRTASLSQDRRRRDANVLSADQEQRKLDEFVDDFFEQFDRDKSEDIQRDETPLVVRRFVFRRYDEDDDNRLTRAEVRKYAKGRIKD